MKIGVFGDSFAEKLHRDIWWEYLQTNHGHIVESFGENGSSVLFSAKKILEKYHEYDFVIWCVTASHRLTVWDRDNFEEIPIHVTGTNYNKNKRKLEIQNKIEIAEKYLHNVYDSVDGELISQCIIEYVQSRVKNLLLIPCFIAPLNHMTDLTFNLFDLSQREADYYFNGQPLADIYHHYRDLRPGHLTRATQIKLAEIINQSLTPGILKARYEDFADPVEPMDFIFRKSRP